MATLALSRSAQEEGSSRQVGQDCEGLDLAAVRHFAPDIWLQPGWAHPVCWPYPPHDQAWSLHRWWWRGPWRWWRSAPGLISEISASVIWCFARWIMMNPISVPNSWLVPLKSPHSPHFLSFQDSDVFQGHLWRRWREQRTRPARWRRSIKFALWPPVAVAQSPEEFIGPWPVQDQGPAGPRSQVQQLAPETEKPRRFN